LAALFIQERRAQTRRNHRGPAKHMYKKDQAGGAVL